MAEAANWLKRLFGRPYGEVSRTQHEPESLESDATLTAKTGVNNRELQGPELEVTVQIEANPGAIEHQIGATVATMAVPAEQPQPAPKKPLKDEGPCVWSVGDVIVDLYEVTGILGQGGMGTVYKVHHKEWDVDLAVKSPKPEQLATDGGMENFVRKCETWINLGLHPNLVNCYYVRSLGGIPRVFVEYVEGGSLSDWIRNRTLYDGGPERALQRVLDVSIQTAWGLHYAHQQGLIHLDVKPANVMMTPGGLVKVTNFGLTKARGLMTQSAEGDSGQSILGVSGGMTPAYYSPERASGQTLSGKTDIWSLGLCVLDMFRGGESGLVGQTAAEALRDYTDAPREHPELPGMPKAVNELLKRCFAKDPDNRSQTMHEVAVQLIEIYQDLFQEPYARLEPQAAELSADSLNNRALSYLDLGNRELAHAVWQDALAADPMHPETTFNRGLSLWRQAKITDEMLVEQLDAVRIAHHDSWRVSHLLTLVHLERGDVDAAFHILEEAAKQGQNKREIQAAIKRARSDDIVPFRTLRDYKRETETQAVCVNSNASFSLFGDDKTLRLLALGTGQCLRTFEGHTGKITSVCLSSAAHSALSGSDDNTVRLWDVAQGRCLSTLEGDGSGGKCVALNADALLAVYRNDKTLKLWDIHSGKCLRTFDAYDSVYSIKSACLSADGRLALVLLHLDDRSTNILGLWEVATGRCLRILEGQDILSCVCFSADARLALAGGNGFLRLWDVDTGRCLRVLNGHGTVQSACFSADGRLALSGSIGFLRLWEVSTGRCLSTFGKHGPSYLGANTLVSFVSVSANSRVALTSTNFVHMLRVWQLPSGYSVSPQLSRLWNFDETTEAQLEMARFVSLAEAAMSNRQFIEALNQLRMARAVPGMERAPKVLDAWGRLSLYCRRTSLRNVWENKQQQGHVSSIFSTCTSANAQLALSASPEGDLLLWVVATGRILRALKGHSKKVVSVSMCANARFALSAAEDSMRFWEVATGRCLRIFAEFETEVRCVCLSADARFAISGTSAGAIRLWEVSTGRCLRVFQGHTTEIRTVCMSADSRLMLSNAQGVVKLWDVAKGVCLNTIDGEGTIQLSLFLSTNELRCVIPTTGRQEVSVCDVSDGRRLRDFDTLLIPGGRSDCALTADSRFMLLMAGGQARLWDAANGLVVTRGLTFAKGSADYGYSHLHLSADARVALRGSESAPMQAWHLDWELEAIESTDWDDGARRYLEIFLNCQTPYVGVLLTDREPGEEEIQRSLTRGGKPTWAHEDFNSLLETLGRMGYGWLRPEGVLAELQRMANDWKGLPLLSMPAATT